MTQHLSPASGHCHRVPGCRGAVICRCDAGYPAARAIWNGQANSLPRVIVHCLDTADVVASVRYARTAGLPLAVRGGGHNVAGLALCDDGLVVDLSAMRGTGLDRPGERVLLQGGARLGDLDAATLPAGRLVPAGIVTDTGVGGLTLGGGIGWATRHFGLTCDHLVAAELVTATGDVVAADDTATPDLMWALRGGGGNFGVVTRFTFRTRPVSPTAVAGFVMYPLGHEVLRRFAAVAPDLGDATTTITFLRLAPPLPWMPSAVVGTPVIMIGVVHLGEPEVGLRAVEPLRRLGTPCADSIALGPFLAHQSVVDAANPAGHRYYWSSRYLAEFSADLADLLVDHARRLSAPGSLIALFQLGGAAAHPPVPSCAPYRSARFLLDYGSHWLDPAEDDVHREWTRSCASAAARFGMDGGYANFQSELGAGHFPPAVRRRLADVKRTYDPDNVFRRNQNIPPAAEN